MSTRKATPDIMGNVLAATTETWNGKELDYPLAKIKVGSRLRPINDAEVTGLVDSIRLIGLLNPIHLLPDGTLVAGNHRRTAAERLGWTHIRARIVELSDVDAELAEIDENLRRSNLTILEEAEHLLRREELLEAKGARAKAGDNQHTADEDGGGATVAPPPAATTAGMAQGLGLSERSAQIRLQIARNLDGQAKDAIRTTELASSTRQLVELARQPAEKQRTIADLIVRGEAANVADAVRIIDPPPAPQPVQPTYWSPAPQPPAEQKAYVSVDPWQVALDTPGSRQHRSEVLARAITPWILEYCDVYKRTWEELAKYGNPSHRLSTFWQDIDKEFKRRGVTVEDATLKEAIKLAFAWLPHDEPAKAQPAATPQRAWPGITAHTWEGYDAWEHADYMEYNTLAPTWRQDAGTFNSIRECDRITRWRVAARLASERQDNLAFSLQETARHLRNAERHAAAEAERPAEQAAQTAVAAADEAFGITVSTPAADQPQPPAGVDAILNPVPVSQRDDYDGDEWYTPAEYIEAARRVMGSIDLDPASCDMAQTVVKADVYLTKAENGLAQRWIRENVWVNPPYSNPAPWVAKVLREFDSTGPFTKQAVVLVNNATETEWFQSLLKRFPVCMLNKRIAFWRHDQSGITARQGQAIFYLGPNVGAFINEFETFGPILRRVE